MKFIQISAVHEPQGPELGGKTVVYALDENGQIWKAEDPSKWTAGWERLIMPEGEPEPAIPDARLTKDEYVALSKCLHGWRGVRPYDFAVAEAAANTLDRIRDFCT